MNLDDVISASNRNRDVAGFGVCIERIVISVAGGDIGVCCSLTEGDLGLALKLTICPSYLPSNGDFILTGATVVLTFIFVASVVILSSPSSPLITALVNLPAS